MDSSVKTWIKKGAAGKGECKAMASLLVNTLRLEFCRQYYKQHKRWPILHIDHRAPIKIAKNYINNTWNETSSNPWTPEDFEHITLRKNLDFDYHIDTSDLLSDKSIIPGFIQYDKQAHRTNYEFFSRGLPPVSKSVIVHYLSQKSICIKDVIDQLQNGVVPQEWRIMVAVARV